MNKIECPYRLKLLWVRENGLKAIIKNISNEVQSFICERYWGFTHIEIQDESGKIMKWKNIFPPVTPSPPSYNFLEPKGEFISNNELFVKRENYSLSWSRYQQYKLNPGNYSAKVSWFCDHSIKTINNFPSPSPSPSPLPSPTPTPTPLPISINANLEEFNPPTNENWSGEVQSNKLNFTLI